VAGKLRASAVRGANERAGVADPGAAHAEQFGPRQVVVDRAKVSPMWTARFLEVVAAGGSRNPAKWLHRLYLRPARAWSNTVSAMLRKAQGRPNRPALVSRAYARGILSVATLGRTGLQRTT